VTAWLRRHAPALTWDALFVVGMMASADAAQRIAIGGLLAVLYLLVWP
jgi:hypothetical protein